MIQGKIEFLVLMQTPPPQKKPTWSVKEKMDEILSIFKTFYILKPVKGYDTDRKRIVANYIFDKLEHVKNFFEKQVWKASNCIVAFM